MLNSMEVTMIRNLVEKGATISAIARQMGIDRKTVRHGRAGGGGGGWNGMRVTLGCAAIDCPYLRGRGGRALGTTHRRSPVIEQPYHPCWLQDDRDTLVETDPDRMTSPT